MVGPASNFTPESAWACVEDYYARMFRNWPGAVTRHIDGYTLSYSGNVHLSGANHIWPHGLNPLEPPAIDEAAAFFAMFDAAWSVICVKPFMDSTIRRLYDRAFTLRWDAALMVLDTQPQPLYAASHGRYDPHKSSRAPRPRTSTRLVQAASQHHLHDVTCVLSEAFATGPSVNRRVARIEHLNDPAIRHYVLYKGVRPVSAATIMIHPNRMASLWNVGTRPRFRRNGYASVLITSLLADLRAHGIAASMLLASPSGHALYERLGYREIGSVAYLGPPYRCGFK